MYYNTTKLSGNDLKEAAANALSQEQKILRFYRERPGLRMSPDYVWSKLFNKQIPITSVRRGITNLTNQERLIKTSSTSIGIYGKKVYRWAINRK